MTEWWRRAVFYEIYVRSFQDSSGNGVGDLAGITQRLDYLNDGTPGSLGVDALWLTPINPSPMYDFGYDVSDYCAVDPLFGTLGDLDLLLAEAHRRGMRVILDLVPNHTSHQHAWFVESRASRTAAKRDWYVWRDAAPGGGPPNNWVSSFGGPAWTLDDATGQYYLHSFLAEQPDLNWRNPAVVEAMQNVIRFWLARGVDGFRVDVIHKMIKDDQFRDNPPPDESEPHPIRDYFGQQHIWDHDRPEVHDIIRAWRRTLDAHGERTMVGEVYLLEPAKVAAYHGTANDELPLAFNFAFQWTPWDATLFRQRVDEVERLWPAGAQPTYVLSSHDAPRHRTRFDDVEHQPSGVSVQIAPRARLAALMLLTLRGTPFLYYGEEIGMRDVEIPAQRICDPVGERDAGLGRDPERTPMQWDATPQAGFSTNADTWLPLASDAAQVNVAAQRADPASLLSFYRRVIWWRKSAAAILDGTLRVLDGPDDTFVYLREHGPERILVVLNFASERRTVVSPEGASGRIVQATMPGRSGRCAGSLELQPYEGIAIELD
ncbi:MAG: alpha-amylase family glycosyl hydrolase [bacterium]